MMWRLSSTVLVQVFKLFLVDVSGRHQSFLHPQQLGWLDSLHHYNTYWYPKQSEHLPYRSKLFIGINVRKIRDCQNRELF